MLETLTREFERTEQELAALETAEAGAVLSSARGEVAALLNAASDEIALVPNATSGMSMIAHGLDLAPGDEVVTTDQEHSGGIGSWRLRARRHGITVRELPLGPALDAGPDGMVKLFADSLTTKTRVVMFSHVMSGLGVRMPARDLCALARGHGAFSVVDGAQAVGQIRVDLAEMGCDAYVASGHKWLVGPKGTGFLFVRRDVQDRVWSTITDASFGDREGGAARLTRYGTVNVPVVSGLRAAIAFITKIGVERIERWNTGLTRRFREGLRSIDRARLVSPRDADFAAGITTFTVGRSTPRRLREAMWERKIRLGALDDNAGVRLSAHLYVTPSDVDRVLDVSESLARA